MKAQIVSSEPFDRASAPWFRGDQKVFSGRAEVLAASLSCHEKI
jgi:hypothetical protein